MASALLFGTPTFAVPVAEMLQRSTVCTRIGVVTKPDEPAGRRRVLTAPPLAAWAAAHGVPLRKPKTSTELTATLRELQPDVAVVAAYGKLIPPEALAIPRFGFVNLHPSLLPRWRGPSPVQATIAAGDTETGVTCILLDREMDHGPIIGQERFLLSPTDGRAAVERELSERGARLLERILPEYLAHRITPQPQDDVQATTCPLLARDDGHLDWREQTAVLERKVRAYEGWPGTWCTISGGRRLKVLRATIGDPTSAPPGTIVRGTERFSVACGDDRTPTLEEVQPEGRAPMPGSDFLRGYRGPNYLPCAS